MKQGVEWEEAEGHMCSWFRVFLRSCAKIIPTLPASGETHGCPFQYLDRDGLRTFLLSCGCNQVQVANIMEPLFRKNEAKHYHVCFCRPLHSAVPRCVRGAGLAKLNRVRVVSRAIIWAAGLPRILARAAR